MLLQRFVGLPGESGFAVTGLSVRWQVDWPPELLPFDLVRRLPGFVSLPGCQRRSAEYLVVRQLP